MTSTRAVIKTITLDRITPPEYTDVTTPVPVPDSAFTPPTATLVSSNYSVSGKNVTITYSISQLYKDVSGNTAGYYCNSSKTIPVEDLCTGITPVVLTPSFTLNQSTITSTITDVNLNFNFLINIAYRKFAETLGYIDFTPIVI